MAACRTWPHGSCRAPPPLPQLLITGAFGGPLSQLGQVLGFLYVGWVETTCTMTGVVDVVQLARPDRFFKGIPYLLFFRPPAGGNFRFLENEVWNAVTAIERYAEPSRILGGLHHSLVERSRLTVIRHGVQG